ncbi:hypothetical protein DXC20_04405 [Bacteroides sp. OM08-17BH]|nr:hypothetical protein DXC20_04405 [Bacteroides sp. OM08-17BH]HBO06230.1 hypothetical protein [Bacteroides sp.]
MDFVSLQVLKPRFPIAGRRASNCVPDGPQLPTGEPATAKRGFVISISGFCHRHTGIFDEADVENQRCDFRNRN